MFDGSRLEEIIGELGVQLNKLPKNPKLADIQQTITLVDWTLVSALPSIMNASLLKASSGSGLVKWRLHTYFEVDRYVPTRIDVTGNSGGEHGVINDLSATSFTDHGVISDSGFPEGWFFGVEESDIGG